jgi:hypothetical protein
MIWAGLEFGPHGSKGELPARYHLALGESMIRRLLLLALACLALADVGCTWCKHTFGCDRKCDNAPPPGCYTGPPVTGAPVVTGPVQYVPAAPPGTCTK